MPLLLAFEPVNQFSQNFICWACLQRPHEPGFKSSNHSGVRQLIMMWYQDAKLPFWCELWRPLGLLTVRYPQVSSFIRQQGQQSPAAGNSWTYSGVPAKPLVFLRWASFYQGASSLICQILVLDGQGTHPHHESSFSLAHSWPLTRAPERFWLPLHRSRRAEHGEKYLSLKHQWQETSSHSSCILRGLQSPSSGPIQTYSRHLSPSRGEPFPLYFLC